MNEMINDPKIIRRNRFYGTLIIFAIAAPMVLAYIMFHTGWGVSGNTTNKGVLITPPQEIQKLVLTENSENLSELYQSSSDKKWRLLVPVVNDCIDSDSDCAKNLYLTRQVHIRLAEKSYRVERIFLMLENIDQTLLTTWETQHPSVRYASTSATNFSDWLENQNISNELENNYYLIDQGGLAMMHYNVNHSGQDLLDDIKKLLKFSYE